MLITIECASCKQTFEHDAQGGARPHRCPPCRVEHKKKIDREKAKRWRAANPERAREQWNRYNRKRLADPEHLAKKREDAMRRAYGLSRADFDALLDAQGHRCAICRGEPNGPGRRLHVDHCHGSKRVRGLLCAKCNTAIGLLDDDPAKAEAAATYLRRR